MRPIDRAVKGGRMFNGKFFALVGTHQTDRHAGERAQDYQRNGFFVRVVTSGRFPTAVHRVYARMKNWNDKNTAWYGSEMFHRAEKKVRRI